MTHNNNYIPSEAYLYFPSEHDRKTKNSRRIFDGNTQFDSKEMEHIAEFREYAKKHAYALKPLWTDNMILRFLQANEFKMQKTLVSVKEHTHWRENNLPVKMDPKLEEFLNSGFLYVHGRDHKFRPIVVFNVYQMDPKTVDMDLVTRALTFWMEYIISDWMLPGQVESWIFICNIKGMGISTMAVPSVRKLFGYLQSHFKCRLHKIFIINASAGIYGPWQIAKKFLDGDTVEKVNFYKTQVPKDLFNKINPDQVEQQFGGNAPNCTQYWPPKPTSSNYFTSNEEKHKLLITEEEYRRRYQFGQLNNMKINKNFTFGMGSFVTPREDEKVQESLKLSGTFGGRVNLRPLFSETILFNPWMKEIRCVEFVEFEENDQEENADYVEEDMNENFRHENETHQVKAFQSYFL